MRDPIVILFDGDCTLCNRWVLWIIARDPKAQFRFAPLSSPAARALLPDTEPRPDSVVLIDESGVHNRSTAVIRIARKLGFPYNLVTIATILPARLRDLVYAWIARNRHNWYGRNPQCALPTPELQSRFL